MKQLYILAVLLCALPLSAMAQDDLYFTPKKKAQASADTEPAYYVGSNRDVDEYNRRGKYWSHYQKLGNDSLGNDIIQFQQGNGVYPDSVYVDTTFVAKYRSNAVDDDFAYSRRMSRWDGYYDPWLYSYRYSYGYSPYYWRWAWYDPWYGDPFYDPWYPRYYGYYGWYNPYYYAGWGWATGAASMSPTVAAVAVMPATALGAGRSVRVRAAAWLTDRTARARLAVATVVPTTTAPSATATTLPARTTITSAGVPARPRCPLVRLAADLEDHAVAASAADTPVVVAADALVADTDNTNPNTQLKTITNR